MMMIIIFIGIIAKCVYSACLIVIHAILPLLYCKNNHVLFFLFPDGNYHITCLFSLSGSCQLVPGRFKNSEINSKCR